LEIYIKRTGTDVGYFSAEFFHEHGSSKLGIIKITVKVIVIKVFIYQINSIFDVSIII